MKYKYYLRDTTSPRKLEKKDLVKDRQRESIIGFPLSGVVYFSTIIFYIINKGYDCVTIVVISREMKIFNLLSVMFFTIYKKKFRSIN
jgi:hypothetical protein